MHKEMLAFAAILLVIVLGVGGAFAACTMGPCLEEELIPGHRCANRKHSIIMVEGRTFCKCGKLQMKYLDKEQSDKRRIDAFLPDNNIMGKLRATYIRISTPRVPGEQLPALAVVPTQDLIDLLKALMLTTGLDPEDDDSWFSREIFAMQPLRIKRKVSLKEVGLGTLTEFPENTKGAGYPDTYEEGFYIFKPDSGKDSVSIFLVKKEDIEVLPLPPPDKRGASLLVKLRTPLQVWLSNGKRHTFAPGTRGTFGGLDNHGLGRFKPSNDVLGPMRELYGKDFEVGWFEVHSTYVEVVKADPVKKVSK